MTRSVRHREDPPRSGKLVTITLDSMDVGQILDGLRSRMEAWDFTAEYMETGFTSEDDRVIEECSSASEAKQIERHYARIVESIEKQLYGQDKDAR